MEIPPKNFNARLTHTIFHILIRAGRPNLQHGIKKSNKARQETSRQVSQRKTFERNERAIKYMNMSNVLVQIMMDVKYPNTIMDCMTAFNFI